MHVLCVCARAHERTHNREECCVLILSRTNKSCLTGDHFHTVSKTQTFPSPKRSVSATEFIENTPIKLYQYSFPYCNVTGEKYSSFSSVKVIQGFCETAVTVHQTI